MRIRSAATLLALALAGPAAASAQLPAPADSTPPRVKLEKRTRDCPGGRYAVTVLVRDGSRPTVTTVTLGAKQLRKTSKSRFRARARVRRSGGQVMRIKAVDGAGNSRTILIRFARC